MEKELFVIVDDECTAIVNAENEEIREKISSYISNKLYGEVKTNGLVYMYLDEMEELVLYETDNYSNSYIHIGYITKKLHNPNKFILDMSKETGYNISCVRKGSKSVTALSLYVYSLDEWSMLFTMDISTDNDYKQIYVFKELMQELINFDPIVRVHTDDISKIKTKTRSVFPNKFCSNDKYRQLCWDIRSIETQKVIMDKFNDFNVSVWEGYKN